MAGVCLKKKCIFFSKQVEYLGHITDANGLHPSPSKVWAVKEAPMPRNLSELRAFLGLTNYYHQFIHNNNYLPSCRHYTSCWRKIKSGPGVPEKKSAFGKLNVCSPLHLYWCISTLGRNLFFHAMLYQLALEWFLLIKWRMDHRSLYVVHCQHRELCPLLRKIIHN